MTMKRNFNDWLAQFRSSIANYEYYTDFNKVFENVDVIKIEFIIRKSKFPPNPERSVQFSGKRTKRSVQKKGCTQHL